MKRGFAFAVAVLAVALISSLRALGQSPDCSTITYTSGGTLVNSAGTWSFSGTEVLLNGSQAAGGFGTLLLIYNGGNLYNDDAGSWYEWNGSGWNSEPGDPRGSGCSGGGGGEGPYGGTAASIPGTVQAENYDTGGQGVGYSVSSVNGTGNGYRSDGVDLETTTDTGGGYDLGWTSGGQWFRYTVDVASSGTYTVTFRVASINAVSDAFHLADSSGDNLSGSVGVPNTGGYQDWTNVTATVSLSAGAQVLTLDEDNAGGWNINYMTFTSGGGGGCTPSASGTTIPSASSITDSSCVVWTLDGSGNSYENGTADGGGDISLLLWYNGNIYADTYSYGWFEHSSSSGWYSISGDPRGGGGGGGVTPYGVSAPSGYHWTTTFDDEFTSDSSLNTSLWNGGAGDTDWCDENAGGEPAATYFFNEDPNNPCAQVYTGLSFTLAA